MDFDRAWTMFAVDAEVDHFGTKRLVDAHNTKVAALESGNTVLRQRVETYKRMNDTVRATLDKAIPGFEGSGAGIVESIEAIAAGESDA